MKDLIMLFEYKISIKTSALDKIITYAALTELVNALRPLRVRSPAGKDTTSSTKEYIFMIISIIGVPKINVEWFDLSWIVQLTVVHAFFLLV